MIKSEKVILIVLVLGFFTSLTTAAEEITAEQIIQKNIAAVGGKEKIENIKTASIQLFSPGRLTSTFYTQGKDLMKVVDGVSPVIESIVIVKNGEFNVKSYRMERILSLREKCFFLAMQKLISGAFTLTNFNNELEYKGIKKLGLEQHYIFEAKLGGCPVQFDLDKETFLLKRMVIEDVSISDYKATYDFLPSADSAGFMIPSGWYQCSLGTGASARGTDWQLNNFSINPLIKNDFFSDMELNMGTTKADTGIITGNSTAAMFNDHMGFALITTNAIKEDLDKAGFKVEDKFVIKLNGKEYEGFFLASTNDVSSSLAVPGNIIFTNLAGSVFYGLIMFGEQYRTLMDEIKPLTEFRIIKK